MVISRSDVSEAVDIARGAGRRPRRAPRGRWMPLLALASTLAHPRGALAQQEDLGTTAQRLFREGRQAIERGDYATGCPKFADSLKLVTRASTLLNLAQCEEHEGRLRSALGHWKQGADLLEAKDERIPLARGKITTLEQRLARLTLTASKDLPAGAEILLDGAPLDPSNLGVEAPLDPGRHTATVKAPGRSEVQLTLDLDDGERRRVELKPGAPVHTTPSESVRPPPAAVPDAPPISRRTLGFIVGGLGVAGLATAGVTGALLLSRNGDIEEQCPNKRCTPEGRALIDGTGPLLVGNAIAWVVGLAGLGAGAWLVFTSGSDGKAAVSAAPLPGGGWLSIRRSF